MHYSPICLFHFPCSKGRRNIFTARIVNPKEDWKSALNLGGGIRGIEGWHCV